MDDTHDLEPEMLQEIDDANVKFEQQCINRHEMGAEKYGEGTFLNKDPLAMAQDELVDLANYVRYMWIKLELMRQNIVEWSGERAQPLPGKEMMGKNAIFQPVVPKPRRGE